MSKNVLDFESEKETGVEENRVISYIHIEMHGHYDIVKLPRGVILWKI